MNMRKFLSFSAACLLLGGIIGLALPTGCSTPQSTAYKAAATTQVTVDTAMHLWGAYVSAQKAAGKPVPIATEQAVKDKFNIYRKAMIAVCDAGAVYSAASSTNAAGATGLAGAFDQAVLNANNTISDLTAFIASLGVKLQ
jgi:hypothetical protein